MNIKKVAIIIPCHNEEQGIGKVIDSIPVEKLKHLGYLPQIIVVDNNSTDKTVQVAKKHGAIILSETKKGKGNAIKKGFVSLDKDVDFVVMLDGDSTYKGHEIPRVLEPLQSNFCDVVVGSRLGGKMKSHSLKLTNRIANWIYTFLVRQIYRANITDVLSGFFAWKKVVTDDLAVHIESTGFSVEMDMITKSVRLGYSVCSVPITYDIREGESKVQAFKDGMKIMAVLGINLIWHPHKKFSKRTRIMSYLKLKMPFLNSFMA